ncbi:MAG: methyltransferase domain-containing protein [Gemmatimonadaceae bacterium]|nr:methyltransferase domain-containing protein [Gemmatimonadaceae bacterium]
MSENDQTIHFDDGRAYERFMGLWSQRVGDAFIDWLTPVQGARWLDVGCGNGAFTERVVLHTAPSMVHGIDPSEPQLVYARARGTTANATFELGDAMALPYDAHSFDIAVMPLVLFFVPEPAVGVSEMARVVVPGGTVAAYAWDMEGGGFPYAALHDAARALGMPVPQPPHPEASRLDVMQDLWSRSGLADITLHAITVQRTFDDFDDYWATVVGGPSAGQAMRRSDPTVVMELRERMRDLLPTDPHGRITCDARAHAVRGTVLTPLR